MLEPMIPSKLKRHAHLFADTEFESVEEEKIRDRNEALAQSLANQHAGSWALIGYNVHSRYKNQPARTKLTPVKPPENIH